VGLCPACPDGGGRGRGGLVLIRSLSPLLGHKVLYAHALSSWSGWVDPGIPLLLPMGLRSSSLMTSWVPGSLPSCCLFLAVVLGRCNPQGPIEKSPSEGKTTVKSPTVTHTVRKKDLILRSIERRPQMQFSMVRKFPLWRLRRYSVKYSKVRNFTFNTPCRRKLNSTSWARTSILWICSPPLFHCATLS
jgi:hypothetical protein